MLFRSIVQLGANDGLRGLPVDQMKKNLTAIVQASKREGARVVLVGMQLPPNYGVPYVNQFRAAFGDVARDERVAFVPFLLEGLDKGVRDVPAFFINGELFTGKPTFDNLKKGIEEALKKKKIGN